MRATRKIVGYCVGFYQWRVADRPDVFNPFAASRRKRWVWRNAEDADAWILLRCRYLNCRAGLAGHSPSMHRIIPIVRTK